MAMVDMVRTLRPLAALAVLTLLVLALALTQLPVALLLWLACGEVEALGSSERVALRLAEEEMEKGGEGLRAGLRLRSPLPLSAALSVAEGEPKTEALARWGVGQAQGEALLVREALAQRVG